MSIASDGYVSVPMCVDAKALDALRAEADYLFNLKHEKDAPDEDDYFEKGCTLDFFTARDLTEDDRARTSMTKYMSRRNSGDRHPRGKGSLLSTAGAGQKPTTCQGKIMTSTDGERGTATDGWSEHHVSIVQGAIFQTLARLAMDALAAHRSARENISPRASSDSSAANPSSCTFGFDGATATAAGVKPSRHHADVNPFATPTFFDAPPSYHSKADRCGSAECEPPVSGVKRSRCFDERDQTSKTLSTSVARQDGGAMDTPLFLFNEQYVVKPPKSSIEFGWHTDEQEQLAMCIFPPGVPPPVYVSVWLALDDCDAANGCLEVCSQPSWDSQRTRPSVDEDQPGVVCLPAKAGDAVVFLSNLWHRSGPNRTVRPRRVFYSQYATDVIRATPSDPQPLRLAVPCSYTEGGDQKG